MCEDSCDFFFLLLDHHIHWSKVSRAYEKQLAKRCMCMLFSSSIIIVTRVSELGVGAVLTEDVMCRMGRVAE